MKSQKTNSLVSRIIINAILIICSLLCIIPLIMVISNSLLSEETFAREGFIIFPKEFCLDAYRYALRNPHDIIESYKITAIITVVGTALGIVLMLSFAYAISRKEYEHRRVLSFYIYFTMLFSGGMVASYIWYTKYLGLYNNILVLILPHMLSPFHIMILRTFCSSIPDSLVENARMEGAGEFYIFWKIIFPLAKAGAATIALFHVFSYWSSWFPSMLYMDQGRNTTIQFYLTRVLKAAEFAENVEDMGGLVKVDEPPAEAVRMAICIIAVGPATVIFPFFQKHFTKGITVGSVKG